MHTNNLLLHSVQCNVIDILEGTSLQAYRFPPFLKEDSIHIWSARYGDLERHSRILLNGVNREEQKTASAFRNSSDANKYLLRHGLLRIILAHYTHEKPEMVPLKTGKNGKPELEGVHTDVSFNLSHTSEMILIGITKKRRIGVDVVKIDPSYRFHESADCILTMGEKAFLRKIEPDLRYEIFFRIWTLKEAILKATGSTLTMMKKIDLSENIQDIIFSPDYLMKFLNTHPSFFLWQFKSGPGHRGSIAIEGDN
jgi:4'-phosphopantetheinyl transferase